jgi:hypothetical protein
MDGTHALAARVEGEFSQTRHLLRFGFQINAPLPRDNAQGRFGWVTQNGPLRGQRIRWQYPSIVAQSSRHEELTHIGIHGLGHGPPLLQQLAFGGIADTRHRELPIREPEITHGHLILGEGPGLVRADDCGTPQGFNGRQALDEGMPACHALGPHRECEGHGGEQPFWHKGHNHPDGKNATLRQRHTGQCNRQHKKQQAHPDSNQGHDLCGMDHLLL